MGNRISALQLCHRQNPNGLLLKAHRHCKIEYCVGRTRPAGPIMYRWAIGARHSYRNVSRQPKSWYRINSTQTVLFMAGAGLSNTFWPVASKVLRFWFHQLYVWKPGGAEILAVEGFPQLYCRLKLLRQVFSTSTYT